MTPHLDSGSRGLGQAALFPHSHATARTPHLDSGSSGLGQAALFCTPTRRREHLNSTAGRNGLDRLGSNKSFLGNSQGEVYVRTPIGKMTCRARMLSVRTHATPRRPMATTCFQEGLRPRTITPRRPRDDAIATRSRHRVWTVSGRLAYDQTHEQSVTSTWPDGNKMDPSAPTHASISSSNNSI